MVSAQVKRKRSAAMTLFRAAKFQRLELESLQGNVTTTLYFCQTGFPVMNYLTCWRNISPWQAVFGTEEEGRGGRGTPPCVLLARMGKSRYNCEHIS